ncbi:PTS transporter subunit EIIC [Serratia sp. PAMC26656]|uniref:PTS transporter subunit EIIC n=1 Tax=Serratia sp. PAMC26656 TaxID=2775909 RepID=UPI0018F6D762|nr:PTS transporter subunit EIIC [Serratia sp. PAMC26656]MBJ7890226.1 PTS transporter subunit EIIC [Serratia sp. PAMC26656]
MSNKDVNKTAQTLVALLGGAENIIDASHCATRLRLVLKDESIVKTSEITELPLIKGQFSNAGQYQIIIGTGTVNQVYKEFIKFTGKSPSTTGDVKKASLQKLNILQRLIKSISDVFVPIIPALVAAGLLLGINNILTAQGIFYQNESLVQHYPSISGLADMISTFSSAAYIFLPILIGFSATASFGGNAYLGAVVGMIMVHPALLNAYSYGEALLNHNIPVWNILSFHIDKVGYQGTIFPVLAASWILAFLETQIRKLVPEILDSILTPLLSVFITSFLVFFVVGGALRSVGDSLAHGLIWLFEFSGAFGGALYGFVLSLINMTGLHHSLLPIDIQMIASGGSLLLALAACNNVAHGGAALSVMLLTDDKKLKGMALSSGVSAFLGITEPAMFGVNLKLRFPFLCAMIGSALGCAYSIHKHIINIAPGPAGYIGFLSIKPVDMTFFFIATTISLISSFVLCFVVGKYKRFD